MLWKFRISEAIYLALSLGYVSIAGLFIYQMSISPHPKESLGGAVTMIPFYIFFIIHLTMGTLELILSFLHLLDKNKELARGTFVVFLFYVIPFTLLFMDLTWINFGVFKVLISSDWSLFFMQLTAILIVITAFFKNKKEV